MLTPELKVAMKYEPPVASSSTKASKATQITGGDLHVKVISAQYLPTKKSGMYDPYVKWWVIFIYRLFISVNVTAKGSEFSRLRIINYPALVWGNRRRDTAKLAG